MRIGELARRTGASERSLRYYEQQGLLRPTRLPSGYRVYGDADVARVARIRDLLAAGLSTSTIAEVLPCVRDVSAGGDWLIACEDLTARLVAERARIDRAMGEMAKARAVLDEVIGVATVSRGSSDARNPTHAS